jgi:hypothetical protein
MEPDKHNNIKWFDLDSLPEKITLFTRPYIEEYKKRIK